MLLADIDVIRTDFIDAIASVMVVTAVVVDDHCRSSCNNDYVLLEEQFFSKQLAKPEP